MTRRRRFFVDLETTGLDPQRHEAWEIAWAFDDEPVGSLFLCHDASRARDEQADEVNGYPERCPQGVKGPIWQMPVDASTGDYDRSLDGERQLRIELQSQPVTLISSAPSAVDIPFLVARWGAPLWHHRPIDISTYAMSILGHEEPMGLWHVAKELRDRGFTSVTLPDHTAAADVESLRSAFIVLEQLQLARTPARWVMGTP